MISYKKAFTLIEIMIVTVILITISIFSYIPYSYYQNKIKLNLSSSQISQWFYEAKSMAISWINSSDKNSSIWLYISSDNNYKNKLTFYNFPYDLDINTITNLEPYFYKNISLQNNVFINNISWKDNMLFYFTSIDWELFIYELESWSLYEIPNYGEKIEINFWYGDQPVLPLSKKLYYYTSTNIIDYK